MRASRRRSISRASEFSACRIDLLCRIDGVGFEEAWTERDVVKVDDRDVSVIGLQRLLQNKRASGRMQDLADVEALEGSAIK